MLTGDLSVLDGLQAVGRAELWWVICDYNDIFFPLELGVGAVLRFPSVEHVNMRLIE